MAVSTVAQFASELNRPATTLLEQLQHAGVSKASTSDALTDADKEKLLAFLRSKLARYKVPKSLRFIEEMPLSPAGKILKRALPHG